MSVAKVITGQNLKDYLSIEGTGRDAMIALIVDGINSMVETLTGRDWQALARDELYEGKGNSSVVLAHFPIQSITQVDEDGIVVDHTDDTEIAVDYDNGILFRVSTTWKDTAGARTLRVQYVGGPDEVPGDLKLAALEMAAFVYRSRGGEQQSRDAAGGSALFNVESLHELPSVRTTLRKYEDSARGYVLKT